MFSLWHHTNNRDIFYAASRTKQTVGRYLFSPLHNTTQIMMQSQDPNKLWKVICAAFGTTKILKRFLCSLHNHLDCNISAAGQPQYIHQQEQHAEDQEVTIVALGREVVPEKSCFFFNIVQKRGGGIQPECKSVELTYLKPYLQLLRKCCFSP